MVSFDSKKCYIRIIIPELHAAKVIDLKIWLLTPGKASPKILEVGEALLQKSQLDCGGLKYQA